MSRRSFRSKALPVAALCFLLASLPPADALEKGKREPIVVTSNRMEADHLGDVVTFFGSVTLKKEAMTMNADELLVLYDPQARGIREIEARGNVKVVQEGRVALAEKALYYSNEEKIVLTGNARVIENENQVGGERITLFLRDERSIVEGGKVLFFQDKKQEEGKAKPALPKRFGR